MSSSSNILIFDLCRCHLYRQFLSRKFYKWLKIQYKWDYKWETLNDIFPCLSLLSHYLFLSHRAGHYYQFSCSDNFATAQLESLWATNERFHLATSSFEIFLIFQLENLSFLWACFCSRRRVQKLSHLHFNWDLQSFSDFFVFLFLSIIRAGIHSVINVMIKASKIQKLMVNRTLVSFKFDFHSVEMMNNSAGRRQSFNELHHLHRWLEITLLSFQVSTHVFAALRIFNLHMKNSYSSYVVQMQCILTKWEQTRKTTLVALQIGTRNDISWVVCPWNKLDFYQSYYIVFDVHRRPAGHVR